MKDLGQVLVSLLVTWLSVLATFCNPVWQPVPRGSKENLEPRSLIDARLGNGKSCPGSDVSDITTRHVPWSQMRDVTESLMMLCEQASKEQDSEKLSNLIEEIIRLLAEKQRLAVC